MAMASQKWLQTFVLLFKKLFHLLTLTLLSLSLPLSFLLFCRLDRSLYLHAFLPPPPSYSSFLASAGHVLLLSLISAIAIAALLGTLLGRSIVLARSYGLTAAWLVLCALQVGVALGIGEGVAIVAIDAESLGLRRSLWCRLMFFLGLHTAMIHWSKSAVKPVVDDTVFGAPVEENWSGRVAMAVSLGGLWWWRLRDEAESPAIDAESMMELLTDLTMADFAGWALYYLIVAIGFVKILRSVVWFRKFVLRKRKEENSSSQFCQSIRIEIV